MATRWCSPPEMSDVRSRSLCAMPTRRNAISASLNSSAVGHSRNRNARSDDHRPRAPAITFWWTRRRSTRSCRCDTTAMRRRNSRSPLPRKPWTETPSTLMVPEWMATKPLMARKRVVLPAPLGPRMATFSPRSTESDTSFKTGGVFLERTTVKSVMCSTGNVHSPCNAGIEFTISKHFQFFRNLSDRAVPFVVRANKALAAQNLQDLIVPACLQADEGLNELFPLFRRRVFSCHPNVIDKRFRRVEDAHLCLIEFTFSDHGVVNRFIEGAGVYGSRFHGLSCGRMTAAVTELQVCVHVDSGSFQFHVRHQVAAGGVDV